MKNREEWLARTLIEMSDTLVTEFDLVDFLSLLAERCVELLEAGEVGLMLGDAGGRLRVMASSTERLRMVELFEVQNAEGPCLDCYRSGQQILNQPLDAARDRWPSFAPMATAAGFTMVHALPLRLRAQVIGAMNVFHLDTRILSPLEANLSQALADAATIGILQERAVGRATGLAGQLQHALNTRIIIEQAKGMLGERLSMGTDEAFAILRSYARGHNLRAADVAARVLDGDLAADAVGSAQGLMGSTKRPKRPS